MIKRVNLSQKDETVLSSLPTDPSIDIIEDPFDYSAVVIEKPWGHEYSIFKNDRVDSWLLFIKPGHRTSMHCHPAKKTSMVLLGGEGAVSTLDEKISLKPGDGAVIEKGVFHSTEAISPRGIFLLETETPVNKKNLVRFDDIYGRAGRRYESGKHVQPRNPSVMPSFYEASTAEEKRVFAECELAVVEVRDIDHFKNLSPRVADSAVVLLEGEIRDQSGNVLFGHADVFHGEELLGVSDNVTLTNGLKILFIRKY